MGRLLAWLGLAAGALAFWRWRLRRRQAAPPAAVDPAEELKQKLAESRAAEPDSPAAEPQPEPEPAPGAPLEDRRRAVHDRARASIDEMRGRGNPPEA
jgi:hypothetical protein